jgi:hypothetical protein
MEVSIWRGVCSGLAAAMTLACGAGGAGRSTQDVAEARNESKEQPDAGDPMPLWESGPGVRHAPKTKTRPYRPTP